MRLHQVFKGFGVPAVEILEMPTFRFLRCLLPALALSLFASADVPRGVFGFKSYGADQGLSNLTVLSLAQDSDGFIWVGTEDGLFRYDGQRFRRYAEKDGLPGINVPVLAASPDGLLWVGTPKGVAVRVQDRFEPVAGLPAGEIRALSAGPGGHAVAAIGDQCFETRGSPISFNSVDGLPRGPVGALWISPDDRELLVSQAGRLWRRMEGAWASQEAPFLTERAHAIHQDHRGRIWIRTARSFHRLDRFQGTHHDLSKEVRQSPPGVSSIAEDSLGRLWVPSIQGLTCFEDLSAWTLDEGHGLPSSWAGFALVDREGSLWMGSEGIHRLQGRFLWNSYTPRQGLPGALVWSGIRSRDGLVWVGTNQGVAVGDERGWHLVPSTKGRGFFTFWEDADGTLWAGGEGDRQNSNVLGYRKLGARTFTDVPLAAALHPSTAANVILGISGDLLVGTMEDGLIRMRRSGGGWTGERVVLPGARETVRVNAMGSIGGSVWAATEEGLEIFDGRTWKRLGPEQGLKEANLIAAAMSPSGELWVAYSTVRGLTRLAQDGGTWRVAGHLDVPDRLVRDIIFSIRFDPAGVMWLGTAQGVKCWNGRRLELFGRGEGLPSDDLTSNSSWADPGGDLWFGTSNGVAHFSQAAFVGTPEPLRTKILGFQDGGGHELGLGTTDLSIQYPFRNVSFGYAVPSYLNEARIGFQVRLAGFEDAWRDTEIREARYTALPPGSYRFEVRSRDGSGELGPAAGIAFRILPPWWMRWWARLIGFGLLGGGVFLLHRWRMTLLHRRNQQLEALVQARTHALEEANRSLALANEALGEASMVDPLTGLRNRRYLGLSLPEETARTVRIFRGAAQQVRMEPPGIAEDLVFLVMDLDHFKEVNDIHGHAAGDAVLKQVGELMRGICRESDTLARWGGEEFLLIAKRTHRAHAPIIARNLLEAFRNHIFALPDGTVLRKTCSIGFCSFPVLPDKPDAMSWEQAMEIADQCMYAAKHSGRNGWVGVAVAPEGNSQDLLGRLPSGVADLVREGAMHAQSSFPATQPIQWK